MFSSCGCCWNLPPHSRWVPCAWNCQEAQRPIIIHSNNKAASTIYSPRSPSFTHTHEHKGRKRIERTAGGKSSSSTCFPCAFRQRITRSRILALPESGTRSTSKLSSHRAPLTLFRSSTSSAGTVFPLFFFACVASPNRLASRWGWFSSSSSSE